MPTYPRGFRRSIQQTIAAAVAAAVGTAAKQTAAWNGLRDGMTGTITVEIVGQDNAIKGAVTKTQAAAGDWATVSASGMTFNHTGSTSSVQTAWTPPSAAPYGLLRFKDSAGVGFELTVGSRAAPTDSTGPQYRMDPIKPGVAVRLKNLVLGASQLTPAPAPAPPPAPGGDTIALADAFTGAAVDTTKWTVSTLAPATAATGVGLAQIRNRIEITPASGVSDRRHTGLVSATTYDLTGKRVFVAAPRTVTAEQYLLVGPSFSTMVWIYRTGTTLNFEQNVSGTVTVRGSIAYDAKAHYWWSIRHDSATDEIVWETAPLTAANPPVASDWVQRARVARPIVITACKVDMTIGSYSAGSWGVGYFAGFNTAMVPHVSAPTISAAAAGPTSIGISLTDTSFSPLTYKLYRKPSAGGTRTLIKTFAVGEALSFQDTGLTLGVTYYYDAEAVGSPPAFSAEVNATTVATTFGPSGLNTYFIRDEDVAGTPTNEYVPGPAFNTSTFDRGQQVSYHRLLLKSNQSTAHKQCFIVCERDPANNYYGERIYNGYLDDTPNVLNVVECHIQATIYNPYNTQQTQVINSWQHAGMALDARFGKLGGSYRTVNTADWPAFESDITASMIQAWYGSMPAPVVEPGNSGIYAAVMGGTGMRPDIGFVPGPDLRAIVSPTDAHIDVVVAQSRLATNWAVSYFTGGTFKVASCITHPNHKAYEYYMGQADVVIGSAKRSSYHVFKPSAGFETELLPDLSHVPLQSLVAYLFTGSYLDHLSAASWASFATFGIHPGARGNAQGIIFGQQLRGAAWSLRTMACFRRFGNPTDTAFYADNLTLLENNRQKFRADFLNRAYKGIGVGVYPDTNSSNTQPEALDPSTGNTLSVFYGVGGWMVQFMDQVVGIIAYVFNLPEWREIALHFARVHGSVYTDPAFYAYDMGLSHRVTDTPANGDGNAWTVYRTPAKRFREGIGRVYAGTFESGVVQPNPRGGQLSAWVTNGGASFPADYTGLFESEPNPSIPGGVRMFYKDQVPGSTLARNILRINFRRWYPSGFWHLEPVQNFMMDDHRFTTSGGYHGLGMAASLANSGDAAAVALHGLFMQSNSRGYAFPQFRMVARDYSARNSDLLAAPTITPTITSGTTVSVAVGAFGSDENVYVYVLGDVAEADNVKTLDGATQSAGATVTVSLAAPEQPGKHHVRVFAKRVKKNGSNFSVFSPTTYLTNP